MVDYPISPTPTSFCVDLSVEHFIREKPYSRIACSGAHYSDRNRGSPHTFKDLWT